MTSEQFTNDLPDLLDDQNKVELIGDEATYRYAGPGAIDDLKGCTVLATSSRKRRSTSPIGKYFRFGDFSLTPTKKRRLSTDEVTSKSSVDDEVEKLFIDVIPASIARLDEITNSDLFQISTQQRLQGDRQQETIGSAVHRQVVGQIRVVAACLNDLAEHVGLLKMWATSNRPPVVDGQNIGVLLFQHINDTVDKIKAFGVMARVDMTNYQLVRAIRVSRLSTTKNGDLRRHLAGFDSKQLNEMRLVVCQLRRYYCILERTIGTNRAAFVSQRIRRPELPS
jgi:hypothetical protein